MVCEDTSRKVKAAFKAKFATGQRIGAYAPIGYRKHPEIKNKLIIDEETRWIVEKIFDLAFHGRGAASITSILIAERFPLRDLSTSSVTGLSQTSMRVRRRKKATHGR